MKGRDWRLLVFLCAGSAFAQSTTQQIAGFVKDPSGLAVSSAKVSVLHVETGQVRTAQVNESGYYLVTNLPIGSYEITAEAAGFKKFLQKNVIVDVNAKVAAEVTLEVGSVNESITVNADAAQVETSNGEVGRLVTGEQALPAKRGEEK